MNLIVLVYFGCAVGILGLLHLGSFKTRSILMLIGFGGALGIHNIGSDYHAQSKETIVYPCSIRTSQDVREVNRIFDMKVPIADSVITLFDPLSSRCGDTLRIYHLLYSTDIRWLHWSGTRAIITNKSIPQYENELQ